MTLPVETLACSLNQQTRLVVCFDDVEGQLREQWYRQSGESRVLIMESVASEVSNWPESPPWQEVVNERHGNSPVLMAIGRAGKSHWSGTWRVVEDGRVDVEFACRVNESPGFVGLHYRVPAGTMLAAVDHRNIDIQLKGTSVRITAGSGSQVDVCPNGQIRIWPALASGDVLPRTIEWQFRALFRLLRD
jgi:hypothetical protein